MKKTNPPAKPTKAKKTLTGVSLFRHENLLTLILREGNQARFIEKVPSIKSGQISALVSGVRGVGPKTARKIEEAYNFSKGTFDLPHLGAGVDMKASAVNSRLIKVLADCDGTSLTLIDPPRRALFHTEDPGAYAIRVVLDWGRPRFQHGELMVVEPNTTAAPGDTVVVKMAGASKAVVIGTLTSTAEDHITVTRYRGNSPETILTNQIEGVLPVVACLFKAR